MNQTEEKHLGNYGMTGMTIAEASRGCVDLNKKISCGSEPTVWHGKKHLTEMTRPSRGDNQWAISGHLSFPDTVK